MNVEVIIDVDGARNYIGNDIFRQIKMTRDGVYKGKVKLEKVQYELLALLILGWFEVYQATNKISEIKKYAKRYVGLVEEETSEIHIAWYKQSKYEILDGIIDLLWVTIGKMYFDVRRRTKNYSKIVTMLATGIIRDFRDRFELPEDLYKLAILEVAYSNWTKPRKTDKTGKVVKNKNTIKPDWEKVFKYFESENEKKN